MSNGPLGDETNREPLNSELSLARDTPAKINAKGKSHMAHS